MSVLSPASQLHQLLMSLFTADELRRFLRYNVSIPDMSEVLPGSSASMASLAAAAGDALLRWNAIDAEFFAALHRERPRRDRDIETCAQAFNLSKVVRDAPASVELPAPNYHGPTPRYRQPSVEAASQRLLALYSAVDRNEATREHAREISELHASLRGRFEELQPGDLLVGGRYLLVVDRTRSTTPGIVWHAYDRRAEREVALRLFNSNHEGSSFPGYIRGQAHAIARLRHPYIAQVLDPDVREEPHYGYSTEFLRGGRLIDRAERLRGRVAEVLSLTSKLAYGLGYAHTNGLIHGGLDLRCIDFAEDDQPRLRDFGLADGRMLARVSVGLLPFMAPELLAGEAQSPAADQYALAKLAVACLTGEDTPPTNISAELLGSFGASVAQSEVLQRALANEPDGRFPGIEAFGDALGANVRAGGSSVRKTRTTYGPSPSGNPFSAGSPLDGSHVPGREEDIDRMLGLIADHGSAMLLGPRRSGKTSLLRHIERALRITHPVWSISLEGFACDTPDALALALDPELGGNPAPARELAMRLKQEARWPVLLIDELGFLRNANTQVMPSVFSWLRSISQESASIVYAGSPGDWSQVMAVAKEQPGSSFGNDMILHELGPLSRESALAFLTGTAPHDVPIPADPLGAWILEDCGTWPFYLQVMGHALVEAGRRRDRRASRDRSALRELYETRLLRERSHIFEGRWSELAPRVRELILLDRDRLPEYSLLSMADRKLLREARMYDVLNGGWLLDRDPPFLEWIRRKYDDLGEA